jgi:Tol biopolymer transport system component
VGPVKNAAGRRIAIGVYDLKTHTAKKLSDDDSEYAVRWLPDSRRVAAINVNGEIVILDADSGRRHALALPASFRVRADSLVVAPDGRTLYVGRLRSEADLWMVQPRDR